MATLSSLEDVPESTQSEENQDNSSPQSILDNLLFSNFSSRSSDGDEDSSIEHNDLSIGESSIEDNLEEELVSLGSTSLNSLTQACTSTNTSDEKDSDENSRLEVQSLLSNRSKGTNEKPPSSATADSHAPIRTPLKDKRITKRRRNAPPPLEQADLTNHTIDSSRSAEPVVVLGIDISDLSETAQYLVCAAGVFTFNLSFGFLQEFVAVELCSRNLGLFVAMLQFSGYTIWSFILRSFVNQSKQSTRNSQNNQQEKHAYATVPTYMYLGLGGLSAIDMAMTNMAMHYINYPAKTLMKSSRVVFTMIFGVLLTGKRYRLVEYLIVLCMVAGLAIFMEADASSNAIFKPMGVVMLTISLICDGATNIISETIMKNYGVGQDELIFRMYSLALIGVVAAATLEGDLRVGLAWITKPGTYDEWTNGASEDESTWNALGKISMIVLFSSMGFFGSSCSAAIIKNFGALTMSMTSTARRATTLFISFFMFDNECTYKHVLGVAVFITSMTTKSLMSRSKGTTAKLPTSPLPKPLQDIEAGSAAKMNTSRVQSSQPDLSRRMRSDQTGSPYPSSSKLDAR